MQSENNQHEINEIRRHIRYLNMAGLAAIFSLTLAGVMVLTEFTGSADPDPQEMNAATSRISLNDLNSSAETQESEKQPSIQSEQPEPKNREVIAERESFEKKAEPAKVARKMDEELQSFEASCNQGALVFSWVTQGSSRYAYEIEKSVDQENYEVFTRAPAPEKVDGKNVYTVEESTGQDEQAYYRLRKVVGKGRFEYSSEVKVHCSPTASAQTTVDVFPNGYGSFRILINSPVETRFTVTLTDVDEKELATQDFEAKQGSNEFTLISDSITRGNYVLRVSNDHMVKEKKVVLK